MMKCNHCNASSLTDNEGNMMNKVKSEKEIKQILNHFFWNEEKINISI